MSSGRGWFEGTMEVISGTVARSSTPTPPYRPGVSHSAPSSPCPRSPGGYSIQRLPSQDTLDRSIHNDSSHGRSTTQIVRDLRSSNAALTAKTAEMEADFMNQMNKLTKKYEYQQKELHEALKMKEKKIATMESRTLSTENRIRDRDSQLSKLKEETAFQRHTIADLKTQLYQLQSEIDDGEYNDGEGWVKEKREMNREMEALRRQVADLSSSKREQRSDQNVLQSWKQLEETQLLHLETKKRLEEVQSALALAENVIKRKDKENEEQMKRVRERQAAANSDWIEKERELRSRLEALESDDIELTKDLRAKVEERDETIVSLRNEVRDYADAVQELKMDVAQTKAAAANQDKYRREEAEDLRILNDAQEEENLRLKETIEDLHDEIHALKESRGEEDGSDRVVELESQLADSRDDCVRLESKLKESEVSNEETMAELRKVVDGLKEETSDKIAIYEEKIAALEKECEEGRQTLATQLSKDDETKQRTVVRADENAAKEKDALVLEFQSSIDKLTDEKNHEITTLKEKVTQLEQDLSRSSEQRLEEVQSMEKMLADTESQLTAKAGLVDGLEESVRDLETKASQTARAKKQLREAQIALVAIDDEKKRVEEKLGEELETLKEEKVTVENSLREQLVEKEKEIAKIQSDPKDSVRVTGLANELMRLKMKMKEREAALAETRELLVAAQKSQPSNGSSSDNLIDPSEFEAMREQFNELQRKLTEKTESEREIAGKLQDRDTTIAALVKSSVLQEQKVASLHAEVKRLNSQSTSSVAKFAMYEGDELMGPMNDVREEHQSEEIRSLRASLEGYKKMEDALSRDISEMKDTLGGKDSEISRLRGELSRLRLERSGGHLSPTGDFKDKLQERDDAISTLVKESLAQEAEIASLKRTMKKTGNQSGPSWDEIERLQKENEIFAGQIIEQDEEIEALKSGISEQGVELESLRHQTSQSRSLSSDSRDMSHLAAELDEVKEANATHCQELRDLRKQLRALKASADMADDLKVELYQAKHQLQQMKDGEGSFARHDAELQRRLDEALASKNAQEQRMSQQMESVRRLRNTAVENLEKQLKEREETINEREEEIQRLHEEVAKRNEHMHDERILTLEHEVTRLHVELEEKELLAEDYQTSVKELRRALDQRTTPEVVFQEKETLTREVNELRTDLANLEEDKKNISEMREKLASAEEERESWERGIVDSYERKISLMKLDKDVTIDGLRKELAELRAKDTFEQEDVVNHINNLDARNKDLEDELEAQLQLKDTKIVALEHAVASQEQLIDNMRTEMDQLQGTMEQANVTRRAEIEEMQREAFESSSKATQHGREVTTLKIKLEETNELHRLEVEKLNDKIASLESDAPIVRSLSDQKQQEYDERLEQVKDRLETLQWRNNSLRDENKKLRERLEKAETEQKATKEHVSQISTLEEEVSSLTKKINELEIEAKNTEPEAAALKVVTPSPREQISGMKRSKSIKNPMSPRKTPASPGRLRFLRKRAQSKDSFDDTKAIPPTAPTRDDASGKQ